MTFLDNGDVMLASCSQDHFIRVWRIATDLVDKSEVLGGNMKALELTSNKFSVISEGNDNYEELSQLIFHE
jgi:WD40 repeat protein